MTNEDVIKTIELEYAKYHLICISTEMDKFIKENYKKGDSAGKFYKVYREGNDAKYGHYMVNPYTQHWRGSTFDEFYGGGIVD